MYYTYSKVLKDTSKTILYKHQSLCIPTLSHDQGPLNSLIKTEIGAFKVHLRMRGKFLLASLSVIWWVYRALGWWCSNPKDGGVTSRHLLCTYYSFHKRFQTCTWTRYLYVFDVQHVNLIFRLEPKNILLLYIFNEE